MTDQTDKPIEENLEEIYADADAVFTCPACGVINRDDVVFLCNTCDQSELIYKNGMYMCPSCLGPGNNFECMLCGSKEVGMTLKEATE
jgi:hypothetical protein